MKRLSILAAFAISLLSAEAKLITKSVPYEHNGVKLEGYLAYDDEMTTPGKTAGILVVHEWWGLNAYMKSRTEELAEMGYVAFAADMFGQVTDDPKKAAELSGQFKDRTLMAARARAGLDELKKVDQVDATKLAAIGFCFGGSTSMNLAYSGAPLVGIVSFHGSPVPAPKEIAGKIKTKFLLLNGAVDPMVKPDARAELEKSLDAVGIDYQSINYSGALHAFTNPDADKIAAEKNMVGMIAYNKVAATRSWQQMEIFFDEIFAPAD